MRAVAKPPPRKHRPPSYFKAKAVKQARKDARRHGERPHVDPICIECGALAEQVTGEAIYPHRPDLVWRTYYLCQCGAYVGTHRGTDIPLGTPAGPETRAARNAAHAIFDPLWEAKIRRDGCSKKEARGAAYKWLAEQLGINRDACHIAMFDAATARRVMDVVLASRRKAAAA